jgi:threonine dehydrogenase-like Zn-dependent dehydrogenase
MKALRFTGGSLAVAELEKPSIPGEALVRVTMSGICNTDLEIVRGYAGFEGTIGHEFVGRVEESPEAPHLIGKRVVGEINVGCGKCVRCMAGDSRHCPDRTVLGIKGRDGCHAEFLTLPSRNLFKVPDSISDRQAVFAEPLAAAIGIGEQVDLQPEQRIAVIGDGKLGLLCAICTAEKAEVLLIGKHAAKIAIAETHGVKSMLLPDIDRSMQGSFDVVIEASGSESGFSTALDLVAPRGKIVLKSTFSGRPAWEAWRVVVDEITVIGSRCGRIGPAIRMLSEGAIDTESLMDSEFPLADGIGAMKRAGEKGVLKVLLRPTGASY